jgi:hypothetical protein
MANRSRMMFSDSGLVVGPSHSDGGVYASVANGPDVELEGGEFIINKEATEDFLPLIKQINDIGRMEQMNNADNAQNAHSAIDALIASASTKMMPGGGMVSPKTPMYQEGGNISTISDLSRFLNPPPSRISPQMGPYELSAFQRDAFGRRFPTPTFTPASQRRDVQNIIASLAEADAAISRREKAYRPTAQMDSPEDIADMTTEDVGLRGPAEDIDFSGESLDEILFPGLAEMGDPDEAALAQRIDMFNRMNRDEMPIRDVTPEMSISPEEVGILSEDEMNRNVMALRDVTPGLAQPELKDVPKELRPTIRARVSSALENLLGSAAVENTKQTASEEPIAFDKNNFPIYDKASNKAQSFRDAFRTARREGKDTFTWDGRSYTTELKKQLGGMIQYQKGGNLEGIDLKKKNGKFSAQAIISVPASMVGDEGGRRYYVSSPQISPRRSVAMKEAKGDARRKMAYTPADSLPAALVEDYFKKQNKKSPLGFLQGLLNREQGGMIQYEEGGPLHSRRMFNQGTGFDKKKSDLNKDGKISEYEKKRGMAIAKSMKNQMQMGGMIGMQQPMMQRPMNPAMNLSPMQRMGNNMPPMMYQEGGSILPSLNTLRGIRRDAMSVLDNVGIENLRQTALDTLMNMDNRTQAEKDLFQFGQPVEVKGPQYFGPPAPRKQKEMRQKSSDLDELLKGLVIEVNPFTGDTITEQSIKEELERIRRRVEQSKKPNMQEGGMISDNNLMGAMANDRRVAALQPDVYSSRMQNGMTGAEAMVVPKLAEAILPAYGVETPLSRRQGAMLNKNAVSPSALNPNVKGLVNRLLVQRLANETT